MKKLLVVVALAAFAATVLAVEPRIIYVDQSVPASGDGTTWAKAFKTIQEGVNDASTEVVDTILVAPGVYADEPGTTGSKNLWHCIKLDRKVHLKSDKGKEVTHIVGRPGDGAGNNNPVTGLPPASCVYIPAAGQGSIVEGFTIRDGETHNALGGANRSAGVGDPTKAGNDSYVLSAEPEKFWYVVHCTISNCCAGRGSAVSGGTLVGCVIADNKSYGSTAACTYIHAYNSIFTRNGDGAKSGCTYWAMINCSVANDGDGARGATAESNESTAFNSVFVDNGSVGDNNTKFAVTNCVYDGGSAALKTANYDSSTMKFLSKGVWDAAATDHDKLFMGAILDDFRPVKGGLLDEAGDIKFTNVEWIPSEWRQTDFYGNKLANDAKIPAGVILPAGVSRSKMKVPYKFNISIDGFVPHQTGQYVHSDKAYKQYRVRATDDAFLMRESTGGYFASRLRDGSIPVVMTNNSERTSLSLLAAEEAYYVNGGKDDQDQYIGSDDNDGLTPETPFLTIQKALDTMTAGKRVVVFVAPGLYNQGDISERSAWISGNGKIRTRVLVNKTTDLMLFATGSREETIIEGAIDSETAEDPEKNGMGPNAARCIVVTSDASPVVVSGFTIRKGRPTGNTAAEDCRGGMGGACLCRGEFNFVVQDCDLTDNAACSSSAGYYTDFIRCRFFNNSWTIGGQAGGRCVVGRAFVASSIFLDNATCPTLISGPQSVPAYNCTFYVTSMDSASQFMVTSSALFNSVLWTNGRIPDYTKNGGSVSNCLLWGPAEVADAVKDMGYVRANPRLSDPASGDFRPNYNSPIWKTENFATFDAKVLYRVVTDYNGNPLEMVVDDDGNYKVAMGAVHSMGSKTGPSGLLLLFR